MSDPETWRVVAEWRHQDGRTRQLQHHPRYGYRSMTETLAGSFAVWSLGTWDQFHGRSWTDTLAIGAAEHSNNPLWARTSMVDVALSPFVRRCVPRAAVHPEFYAKRLGRLHHALSSPLDFGRMLLEERRTGERKIPDIGNLPREVV